LDGVRTFVSAWYQDYALRASCHVSQLGKVCTKRQENPIDCLIGLGEWRRRISRFIEIHGQANW